MGLHFPWVYRSRARYVEERELQHRGMTDRLVVLEALVVALGRRIEVIELIGGSADPDAAHAALVVLLGIDETEAWAVLDLQLRQLSELSTRRLIDDRDGLRAELGAWDPEAVADGPRWLRRGWFAYDER